MCIVEIFYFAQTYVQGTPLSVLIDPLRSYTHVEELIFKLKEEFFSIELPVR